MNVSMDRASRKGFVKEERGITGLETAIVLIAFVVVSSVFAFAALSTGLFSSDKSKDAHLEGNLLGDSSSEHHVRRLEGDCQLVDPLGRFTSR